MKSEASRADSAPRLQKEARCDPWSEKAKKLKRTAVEWVERRSEGYGGVGHRNRCLLELKSGEILHQPSELAVGTWKANYYVEEHRGVNSEDWQPQTCRRGWAKGEERDSLNVGCYSRRNTTGTALLSSVRSR